jgi:hypothetical protein
MRTPKGIYTEDHLRHKIRQFLIAGGLEGRKQTAIVNLVNHMANSAYIVHELEILLAEDKVQKFVNGHKTTWRATEKILESTNLKQTRRSSRRTASRKARGLRS